MKKMQTDRLLLHHFIAASIDRVRYIVQPWGWIRHWFLHATEVHVLIALDQRASLHVAATYMSA